MYGHVEKLAEEINKGAASVEGVEAKLWQACIYIYCFTCPMHSVPLSHHKLQMMSNMISRNKAHSFVEKIKMHYKKQNFLAQVYRISHCTVPETLPNEVLGKMSAPPKSDVPVITPNELSEADGFVFGFPTRFGMMSAQFKAFLDATGGLWRTQQLAGKPAGIFYSTGSQGGGQETTALTAITQLVHHGMIFVPIGYTFGAGMFEMEQVKGGSPYGAGTYAGDGSRQPTELELQQAFHQGKYIATITKKLKESA
ncbi:hypothetical protein Lal_00003199 [Lupinus albus]|nr:hypothetical protein Lal_00003199 [Lupinus albus]